MGTKSSNKVWTYNLLKYITPYLFTGQPLTFTKND